MSTSGTATYNDYADELITDAYMMNGVEANSKQRAFGLRLLNRMIKGWQAKSCFLHALESTPLYLTASDKDYTLAADTLDIANVRFRRDNSDDDLTRYSREEYQGLPNKTTSGDPIAYYLDRQLAAPVLYLYYNPSYTTSLVSNNGTDYRCIKDHTSAAADEPGVGANTATYWESIGSTGAYTAWAASSTYRSDTVWYDQVRKIEDITFLSNTLDLPQKQHDAVFMNLVARIAMTPDSKLSEMQKATITSEADALFRAIANDDNETGDMCLSPAYE